MHRFWFFALRTAIGGFAGLIGVAAAWTLAAEQLRPRLPYFPADAKQAAVFTAAQARSGEAVRIAWKRGDLWTDAALANAASLLFEPAGNPAGSSRAAIGSAQDAARRAASLSPHDSRIWLVLASLQRRAGGNDRGAVQSLKLSYYTGPNEPALAPLRLAVAVGIADDDDELQELVRTELQRIVLRRPNLKPAIKTIYQNAPPRGRAFIQATLKQVDPAFLATLSAP